MVTRQFHESPIDAAYVSLILSLLVLMLAQSFNAISISSQFNRITRRFLADYGLPIVVIAVSACAYWGRFELSGPSKLPVGDSFEPAGGRSWLVPFWDIDSDPKWIAIAIPFGFVSGFFYYRFPFFDTIQALFILFAFDHQVSVSVIKGMILRSLIVDL